jgi:hypothetical protein
MDGTNREEADDGRESNSFYHRDSSTKIKMERPSNAALPVPGESSSFALNQCRRQKRKTCGERKS